MKIQADVRFDLEVPDDWDGDPDEISFEIPYEQMRVDGEAGPIEGAKVLGYCTTNVWGDDDL